MTEPRAAPAFDAAAYLDAAAAALGLAVAPEYRPGVVANLERLHAMAQLVMGWPLGPEDEPAPVFTP